jgi:transcriptional regulator with XRE-family HTH domain
VAKARYKKWLTDEGKTQLRGWARDGLTDEQIAAKMGIATSTLYNYKKNHVEIVEALKKGKEVVDQKVEDSLLARAMGTKVTDQRWEVRNLDKDVLAVKRTKFLNEYKLDHPDMSLSDLKIIAVEHVKPYEKILVSESTHEVPPDVSAAIFWLKNRMPDKYRDKTFRRLNEAEARKAEAEAVIAETQAELAGSAETAEDKLDKFLTIIQDSVSDDDVSKGDGPPDGNT